LHVDDHQTGRFPIEFDHFFMLHGRPPQARIV
jgi:hypothetical protein